MGCRTTNAWGEVPRDVRNHTVDSTRWRKFRFRDDDIVIATWAKTGTTWLQQILGQLIFGAVEDLPVADISQWVDRRGISEAQMLAMLEAQTHRRFIKTHLSADALIFCEEVKYLYLARDGRDVVWSWYNHHQRMSSRVLDLVNAIPGRVGPPLEPADPDIRLFFRRWLEQDGYPLWPFWSHVRSWWDLRERPNVRLLHFNDLKADPAAEIRGIAHFLGIEVPEQNWPRILRHSSFDYMKQNAKKLSVWLDHYLEGGARAFVNRGANGRWQATLSAEEVAQYEAAALANLGDECAQWLASGRQKQPLPPP